MTSSSPLYLLTSSWKDSMTPFVSPRRPFSDITLKRFLVMSESGVFFVPVPSAAEKRPRKPAARSFAEIVGFVTNAARSGVFLIVVEIVLSSPATFVSVWGDCASDAPYAAWAYLRAIDDAERVRTVRERAAAGIVLAACRANIVEQSMRGRNKFRTQSDQANPNLGHHFQ